MEGEKMNFSPKIKEKINQFAKEQSQQYLKEAERRKTGQSRSETTLEAQNDMIVYMSDYMHDLIAKGLSEQEAFERAREDLKFSSENEKSTDLQQRFREYYENFDPADQDAIGLFYAGFTVFGLSIGALVGFLSSGGREMFLSGGWIDTLIGVIVGAVIGSGFGLISNAIIVLKTKR